MDAELGLWLLEATVGGAFILIVLALGWSMRDVLGHLRWEENWPMRRIAEDLEADQEAAARRDAAILDALEARNALRRRPPWRGGGGPTI